MCFEVSDWLLRSLFVGRSTREDLCDCANLDDIENMYPGPKTRCNAYVFFFDLVVMTVILT